MLAGPSLGALLCHLQDAILKDYALYTSYRTPSSNSGRNSSSSSSSSSSSRSSSSSSSSGSIIIISSSSRSSRSTTNLLYYLQDAGDPTLGAPDLSGIYHLGSICLAYYSVVYVYYY